MYDKGVGLEPDFGRCRVISVPDEEHVEANRAKQRAAYAASHPLTYRDEKDRTHHIGKATRKRRRRKAKAAQT